MTSLYRLRLGANTCFEYMRTRPTVCVFYWKDFGVRPLFVPAFKRCRLTVLPNTRHSLLPHYRCRRAWRHYTERRCWTYPPYCARGALSHTHAAVRMVVNTVLHTLSLHYTLRAALPGLCRSDARVFLFNGLPASKIPTLCRGYDWNAWYRSV